VQTFRKRRAGLSATASLSCSNNDVVNYFLAMTVLKIDAAMLPVLQQLTA